MNIRTISILFTAVLVLAIAAFTTVAQGNSDDISDRSDSWMQEGGDEAPDDDEGSGDDEEGEGSEDDGSDGEPAEDESGDDTDPAAAPPPGMSDVLQDTVGQAAINTNLLDALAGIADYEVTYNTNKSRSELTPPPLRALGEEYAGENSPVAERTRLLDDLNLLAALDDRYQVVEDEHAASTETDWLEDDPDRTLNYYQPRGDPFVITDLIPDELRPELDGTGLDGAVDPNLLEDLMWANLTAQLRLIPIRVIGTIQSGPNKVCIYSIGGWGNSNWINEGDYQGSGSFGIYCAQVSEDFVVLILMAGQSSVTRTFHVSR